MGFRLYAPWVAVLFAFGLFGRSPDVFASSGVLSPHEISLMEFQKEREDLLRNRASERNPHILKNKLTILNNKIAYLESQIRRMRPYMVRQRLVPAVTVPWLDRAPQETSAHAQMAWTPNVTEPKPGTGSERRMTASEAPMPEEPVAPVAVAVKSAASAEKRAEPQTRETVRKVDLRPALVPAGREAAVTHVVPLEAASKPVAAPSPRLAADRLPDVQKAPAPATELKPAPGPRAPKTGADWKKMTRADKEIYILSVMGNLSRRDVYLMKPYNYYIQTIDQAVEKNPLLEREFIHRILMMTAYESEPDTRKDLEKVWK